jgi:hypothetical protein
MREPWVRQRRRRYITVGIFMALYFTFYFLMLTRVVEEIQFNPYQGASHDANGIPIGP